MSDASPSDGQKRALPSWMSSRKSGCKPEVPKEKSNDAGHREGSARGDQPKGTTGHGNNRISETGHVTSSAAAGSADTSFSKLLEGVVIALSGFVNPERGTLRSQALEMGAEYKPDWNSDCTLLVCAFRNTPKFRLVEDECGTIVSKEWISECYTQKKLVDIDPFLMHAGKPWRKSINSSKADQMASLPSRPHKQDEKASQSKPTPAPSRQHRNDSTTDENKFPPPQVKKWAMDDFNKTISWLENQEEKPEPSEIKKIAAEGILTCLQDAIDSLEQKQDVSQITEQWNFIPRVVEELAKAEKLASYSKRDLLQKAKACKQIYEEELEGTQGSGSNKKQKTTPKSGGGNRDEQGYTRGVSSNELEHDSDETIEMTEEEIDLAYNTVASTNL